MAPSVASFGAVGERVKGRRAGECDSVRAITYRLELDVLDALGRGATIWLYRDWG